MSNHGWHTEVIDLSDIYLAVTKQGLICRAFAMKINQLCWNKSYTLAQTAFGQPAVNLFVFCEGFSFLFLLRKFEYFMRISQNVIKNKSFALKKIELESKMTLSSFFSFGRFLLSCWHNVTLPPSKPSAVYSISRTRLFLRVPNKHQ